MQKQQNKNNTDTIQHKKKFDMKYTHTVHSSYKKTGRDKTSAYIMSHF
jgi:hypothetical protein